MKVLVIGSEGSTGKRYCKILEKHGHDVYGYEKENHDKDTTAKLPWCNKVIIACPTNLHKFYFYRCKAWIPELTNIDILVEKPASNRIDDISGTYSTRPIECKMVCNWAFVFPDRVLEPGKHSIVYASTHTGNEGYWFDTCQLHILSNGRCSLNYCEEIWDDKIPHWEAFIDEKQVTKEMIEKSYERMIKAWLETPDFIWNVQDLIPELSYIIRKQEIENGQV